MSLKIFRCLCCGAKVAWKATECPVCNRLVSNDRAKRRIIIITSMLAVMMAAVIILLWKQTPR